MTGTGPLSLPSSDRLKDVAAINARSLPASTQPEAEIEYIDISNVDYFGVVDRESAPRLRFEDAPSRARRRIAPGATIVSSVRPALQTVAHFADANDDLICSTGFNTVEPIPHRMTSRFAYYVLISDLARQHFEAHATGVGYPAIGDKWFGVLDVPTPIPAHQIRVSEFLDFACASIDRAERIKRDQIATLDQHLRTEVENRILGKGTRARRNVSVDWIATLPSHWDSVQVKRVVSRMDYGISEATDVVGAVPVLKMGHLQRGEIEFEGLDFVASVEPGLVLRPGEILYNRTNSRDQVGKAAIFRGWSGGDLTFASYLVRLVLNHRVDAEYLNYVLNSAPFLAVARSVAIPSVAQSNLNSTRYGRLWVPLPPLHEQADIARALARIGASVGTVQRSLRSQVRTLRNLRKALIYDCVTGRRAVTDEDLNRVRNHAQHSST